MDFDVLSLNVEEVLSDYKIFEENIRLLKQTLSTPLFVVLLDTSVNAYYLLEFAFKENNPEYLIAEPVIDFSKEIIVIFSLIICSSKISEAFQQIKESACKLIENHQLSMLKRRKDVLFLDRLEKKAVIFLSYGGMVGMKNSLLLSIVGTVFTYGLII